MSSESNPVADWVPANELIFHLRSSFFPHEFDFVAKTLTDREDQLVSDNVKLNDELKVKQSEIGGLMKVSADVIKEFEVYEKQILEIVKKSEEEKGLLVLKNAEFEKRIGAYEKRSSDDFGFKFKAEKEKKVMVLEKMKLVDELKARRDEIDEALKVNAEREWEIAVYKKRVSDYVEFQKMAEEEKKLLVLENLELNDELRARRNEIEKRSADDLEFKMQAGKEKVVLVSKNLKLNEELETKRSEIDLVMKVNAEYERKIGVYEKRVSELLEYRRMAKEEKELLILKNLELNDELKARRNEIDLVNAEYERKIGDYEKRVSECLEFKRKAEEEKELLVSKNWDLFDELKTRRNEIDAVMKVKAECEGKIRDCEKRYLDELAFKTKAVEEKELLVLELKARRNETDAAMKANDEYEKRLLDELELRTKAEEEKDQLVSVNSKLNDELKTKQNMIDELMKVNAEFEEKSRVYEKQATDDLEFKLQVVKEKAVLVSKNLKLNEELEMKRNEIDLVRKVNAEHERKIGDYEKRVLEFLKFKRKAEEEKELLVSKNLELDDELKARRNEIDAAMRVKAECEGKIRDCEKRYLDELALKKKAEEEKQLLVLENLKLTDELKTKQNEIDAVMKVVAEHGSKTRVYKNRSMNSDAKVFGSEKLAIGSVGSGKEKKDCASESDQKPPLVSVKKDSKRKTEVKLPEIVDIDDDDDDLESVPTNKRRQVLNEKTELRYPSRLCNTCRNK